MPYVQVGENDLLQRRVYLHLVDATDGITAKTGQTGTGQISINGNPPTTSINSLVEIDATNLPGDYYLLLDQKEIATLGTALVRFKNGATAEFVTVVDILAFNPRLPISLQPGFNSVSGPDIDYSRIGKLLQGIVDSIPKPSEPKEPDLEPVIHAIHALYDRMEALEGKEVPETDLKPLLAKLDGLKASVAGIDLNVDFSPLLAAIKQQATDIEPTLTSFEEKLRAALAAMKAALVAEVATLADRFEKKPIYLNVTAAQPPAAPEAPKRDVLKEYLATK